MTYVMANIAPQRKLHNASMQASIKYLVYTYRYSLIVLKVKRIGMLNRGHMVIVKGTNNKK